MSFLASIGWVLAALAMLVRPLFSARVVFRVARIAKTLGFATPTKSTSELAEVLGFELFARARRCAVFGLTEVSDPIR